MTTTRIYRSTDTGLAAIDGTVGSLVTQLDLVLNTGTGLSQPSLGWGNPYSGTNGKIWRPPEGLRYYVKVDDNGPGAGGGKEARVVCAEQATAFATLTNLIPTAAQAANGLFIRKSATADSAARSWWLIGDERTFYMGIATGDSAGVYFPWYAGEIESLKSGDLGAWGLIARVTENSASLTIAVDTFDRQVGLGTASVGHYLARDTAGTVGAITSGHHGDMGASVSTASGTVDAPLVGLISGTNAAHNKYLSAPVHVHQAAGGAHIRGNRRGMRHLYHVAAAVSDGDTMTGDATGTLTGRSFIIFKGLTNGGVAMFDTGVWPTTPGV